MITFERKRNLKSAREYRVKIEAMKIVTARDANVTMKENLESA